MATRAGRSPSYYLIPIAFGSLLGGTTTLIGTPPNLIISGFREQMMGQGFAMFDFLPVGGLTALVGVIFLSFIGWKFIPVREGQASPDDLFHIEDYLVEVRVPENSEFIGQPIDAVQAFHETDTIYVGLSRGGKGLIHLPASHEELRAGDVLLIEADKETLETFLQKTEFELAGSKDFSSQVVARVQHPEEQPVEPKMSERAHMDIQEVVVRSNSRLAGRSVREVNLLGQNVNAYRGLMHDGEIADLAQQHKVKTSRIAHGVPVGGELEFIDSGTLTRAFAGRQSYS